ncbi:hypothetical protein SAMN02910358_00002 [Lachnospiraceae bacterium XBB1006]|nr:hypothetical protein SAMN02910358_00002 [Lachnospiraceae bacterium XBB1006]
MLARALSYPGAPKQNLEEFLRSAGLKEALTYECLFDNYEYENITEDIREVAEVMRSGWGYGQIRVWVDGDFLKVPKTEYDASDFIGNSCRIPVYVLSEQLHGGRNYATITFECEKQSFRYTFVVHKGEHRQENKEVERSLAKLVRLYVERRVNRLMPASWAAQTLEILNHLLTMAPDYPLLQIAKAQVLLLCEREKEAQWILEKEREVTKQTNTMEYGYYLYVTTLLNTEKEYVHKVAGELQRLHMQQKDDPLIFWMLLFTGESYANNPARRYRALKGFCLLYSHSPIFYAEAFMLVKERPQLLEEFGEFEVRLLHWAWKEQLLTEGIGLEIAEQSPFLRSYYPLFTPVLNYFYETYKREEFLSSLCAHYVTGGVYDKKVLPVYEKAVEANLKIYGLFEAYMRCACENGKTELLPMLQYYLPFVENLPYIQQAALYAGIVKNRDKQATLYFSCKKELEQFALKQLAAGHMDENLGILYDFYFSQVPLTEDLARQLAPLLYVHKLSVEDTRMQWVLVVNRQLKKISRYPIVKGVAYFPIYGKDRIIAFEDSYGNRYAKTVEYDLQRLMSSEALTRKCMKLAPQEMTYLIHFFDYEHLTDAHLYEMEPSELEQLQFLAESSVMTEEYKRYLHPVLLKFYYREERYRELDAYLDKLDMESLGQAGRSLACELLIERGFYEKAFEGVVVYGGGNISGSAMLKLCVNMIAYAEGEEDPYLVNLCKTVFERGKYNEVVLSYLVKYEMGATQSLYELWMSARDFAVSTFALEERLLVQMLYTGVFVSRSDEVLRSYRRNGGKQLITDAYVSYFSYQYFVRDTPTPTYVMEYLLKKASNTERLTLCQKFALLCYLAKSESTEYALMRTLYEQFVLDGYVFSFFDRLPGEVTVRFPRKHKKVIEYRTHKNMQVTIRYLHTDYAGNNLSDHEYQVEQMEEMYEGIYVKEITLFYGDTVQYYISEEQNGRSNIVTSGQISQRDISGQEDEGCYSQLNSLIISEQLGEHQIFEKRLAQYDAHIRQAEKELVWIR